MKKFKGSAWNDGKHNSEGKGYGIRIGKKNRDLYFDENWNEIQLSIENDDYFKIKITDGFWRNCTEFSESTYWSMVNHHWIFPLPHR